MTLLIPSPICLVPFNATMSAKLPRQLAREESASPVLESVAGSATLLSQGGDEAEDVGRILPMRRT